MSSSSRKLPLSGIKVLEIAGLAPAPYCGLILADYGADVVRIDRYGAQASRDLMARGKRSISLNLKTKEGIETLLRLMDKADVLIEPFRAGVAERLGIGPEVACKRNPRLIYARLTGWGQSGPFAKMAGHDVNYLSITGALSRIGREDENPMFPVNLLADFAGGGLMCAFGIIMALFEREKSGTGQVVDAAMIDGVAYISTFIYKMQKVGLFEKRGTNMLDSGAHFYEIYKTKDGEYMAVGAIEPQFYAELLKGLGLNKDDLPDQNDNSTWKEMKQKFASIFASKTRKEWCEIFDGTDACVTPILNLNEVAEHPHNKARQLLSPNNDGLNPTPAPRLSRTPAQVVTAPDPEIGEHTVQVLREYGFSATEIERLAKEKAIDGVLPKASL